MTDQHFCQFCGEQTDTPCVDETDLHIYSRTIQRCSDASFNYEAERHFEGRVAIPQQDGKTP